MKVSKFFKRENRNKAVRAEVVIHLKKDTLLFMQF